MSETEITLTQHILGLRPYILVEVEADDEELALPTKLGGGIPDAPNGGLLLLLSAAAIAEQEGREDLRTRLNDLVGDWQEWVESLPAVQR